MRRVRVTGAELILDGPKLFEREPYVIVTAATDTGSHEPAVIEFPSQRRAGVLDGLVLFNGLGNRWLQLDVRLLESDDGFRKAGAAIDRLRARVTRTGLGAVVFGGAVTARLTLSSVASLVANRLRANGDDQLLAGEIAVDLEQLGETQQVVHGERAALLVDVEVTDVGGPPAFEEIGWSAAQAGENAADDAGSDAGDDGADADDEDDAGDA